jgi:hypothetical protein
LAAGAKAYAVLVIFVLVFGTTATLPANAGAAACAKEQNEVIRVARKNRIFFYAKALQSQRTAMETG